MSFGIIIFNFNPLHGHCVYPPFFPNTGAKKEKTPFSKGSKNFCPRAIYGDFFLDTRVCIDSEKLKILLWGLLSNKFYTTTRLQAYLIVTI